MTGLEKIIKEIREEAAAGAGTIIAEANSKAKEILDAAAHERETRSAKTREETDRQVAAIQQGRESALDLARRRQTLQTKQEIIDETLNTALTALYDLPDSEYFGLLAVLAAKSAEQGKGTLYLNAKDLARMPQSFEQDLAAKLPAGGTVTVSKETRPIDGGFVLQYGDIEENCSFSAIFDARRDDFADLVQEILFV